MQRETPGEQLSALVLAEAWPSHTRLRVAEVSRGSADQLPARRLQVARTVCEVWLFLLFSQQTISLGHLVFCRNPRTRCCLPDCCVRQVQQIGHGRRARLNSNQEHIPLFDRNATIPSSRPAVWQSAARSGSQGWRRDCGGTGAAGAQRPPLSRGQALDRASTVLG